LLPPPSGVPPAGQTITAPVAAAWANVHLDNLLQQVVAPLHRQAEAAGQRLLWAVDEVLPTRIHSDPAFLSELVQLLLLRALALVAPQGAQGRVVLKVGRASLDNGHPALHLAFNASALTTAEEAALDPRVLRALDLAVALGGDLMVRSRTGIGHVVSVRLPLRGASRGE